MTSRCLTHRSHGLPISGYHLLSDADGTCQDPLAESDSGGPEARVRL